MIEIKSKTKKGTEYQAMVSKEETIIIVDGVEYTATIRWDEFLGSFVAKMKLGNIELSKGYSKEISRETEIKMTKTDTSSLAIGKAITLSSLNNEYLASCGCGE